MSTIDLNTIHSELMALREEVTSLRGILAAKSSTVPAAETKGKKSGKKVKDANAPKRPPTAWVVFTTRVAKLLADNGYDKKKDLGIQVPQFCADLKVENDTLEEWSDEDILARRAAWTKPEKSRGEEKFGPNWCKNKAWRKGDSAANSVVSADKPVEEVKATPAPAADKPKKERKPRTTKAKEVAVVPAPVSNNNIVTPQVPVTAVPAPSSGGFRKASVRGTPYLVNMESGHAYKRLADGSQGDWAGIFHREGHTEDNGPWIDDSVAEPVAEEPELVF